MDTRTTFSLFESKFFVQMLARFALRFENTAVLEVDVGPTSILVLVQERCDKDAQYVHIEPRKS